MAPGAAVAAGASLCPEERGGCVCFDVLVRFTWSQLQLPPRGGDRRYRRGTSLQLSLRIKF